MKRKKDIPVLAVYALVGLVLAGCVITVQDLTNRVLEQSMIRVFVSGNEQAQEVAAQIRDRKGIVKMQVVEQDQAAAEFEAALGYAWPGADPLPEYIDAVVEPADAAAVVDALEADPGIEYVAYHREQIEQLAGLALALRRAYGLLLLLTIVAALMLAGKVIAICRTAPATSVAVTGLLVLVALGLFNGQAAHAQTATELKQVYREVQAELAKLQKEYAELEKEAAGLAVEVEAGEKSSAKIQSELEQARLALSQTLDQISGVELQLDRLKQNGQSEARHYGQSVSQLQKTAGLAARGRVEHEAKASLFLDYLLYASGKAYTQAAEKWAGSQNWQRQLEQELAELQQERQQLDSALRQLKQELNQINQELMLNSQQLTEVRQGLKAVQRMIYTQESKAWHGRRNLQQQLGFTDFGWPLAVRGVVSSDYGSRQHPIFNEERFHTGVDLPCEIGTPIKAAAAGTVVLSEDNNGYGLTVVIDHGGGVSTLYAHASKLLVNAGDRVQAGETIALAGSTGLSTGPHLHFEVRQDQQHVDPWIWLS